MKIRRLFEDAPYQRTFKAKILESRRNKSGNCEVILDQTLFYPVSGGQPCDYGTINAMRVTDVFEENGTIVHVLEKDLEKSTAIQGEIDWGRRFGHMQQHSGQHILSQSFYQILRAETVGFHLGEENSTLDLNTPDLSADKLREIEEAANSVVTENRSILVYSVPAEKLKTLPMRKFPENRGDIRIVEVEGYDWSGCCGTHVNRTGEVGIIKIIRYERYKGGSRIGFLCGQRALRDYQEKQVLVRETCQLLTAGEDELLSIIKRLQEERKIHTRRIRSLTDALLEYEATALYQNAEKLGPYKIVISIFKDLEPEDIQNLVKKLIQHESVIALVGLEKEKGYLCFGRSQSVDIDMRPILKDACDVIGGKGGGSPFMAQGNGPEISKLETAIQKVKSGLLKND
ncbi:DHHA1 domain-containing protein [bacterium]